MSSEFVQGCFFCSNLVGGVGTSVRWSGYLSTPRAGHRAQTVFDVQCSQGHTVVEGGIGLAAV